MEQIVRFADLRSSEEHVLGEIYCATRAANQSPRWVRLVVRGPWGPRWERKPTSFMYPGTPKVRLIVRG